MKKFTLLATLWLLATAGFGQYVREDSTQTAPKPAEVPKPAWRDRVVYGGSFGASFGNVIFVDVSPAVGYRATDNFTPAFGLIYNYYSIRGRNSTGGVSRFSSSAYGARVLGIYSFLENFFVQAEMEAINVRWVFSGAEDRRWYTSPFLGGGFQSPVGRKGFIMLAILYNVNYQNNNPLYDSPYVVRSSFFF